MKPAPTHYILLLVQLKRGSSNFNWIVCSWQYQAPNLEDLITQRNTGMILIKLGLLRKLVNTEISNYIPKVHFKDRQIQLLRNKTNDQNKELVNSTRPLPEANINLNLQTIGSLV